MTAWQVAAGFALDLLLGDPRWLPHPVRAIGWFIAQSEARWRRVATSPPALRAAGVALAVSTVALTGAVVWATLWLTPHAAIYWIWSLLALRDLDVESSRVAQALQAGDLTRARRRLSRIVGRDTATLDEAEVWRATIETVAENLSDAVVAPLFWLALGGPVAMGAYKAVNTLDSMVGYRNERYREFGWFSARLDDAANWFPSRIAAVLVWLVAAILRYNARQSVRITRRDARKQPSPNAGYPQAAVAGALDVRLGGVNYYQGVASRKEYLGEPTRALDARAFAGARRLLYGSGILMGALVCAKEALSP